MAYIICEAYIINHARDLYHWRLCRPLKREARKKGDFAAKVPLTPRKRIWECILFAVRKYHYLRKQRIPPHIGEEYHCRLSEELTPRPSEFFHFFTIHYYLLLPKCVISRILVKVPDTVGIFHGGGFNSGGSNDICVYKIYYLNIGVNVKFHCYFLL